MKTRILKVLGAGAAVFALAMPASAFTISLDVVGQNLNVSAAGLTGETITGYDLDVTFSNALDGLITGVTPSDQLGAINFLDFLFFDTVTAGSVNGFAVSLLTNAQVDAIQTTDPVLLFTLNFGALADLTTGNFALGPNSSVVCANPNAPGTSFCFPPVVTQMPEPTTALLVATALGALALRRKKPQLA